MKEKKVTRGIPQPSLSFVNTCSGKILTDIWTPLEEGLWQEFLVDNYLKNDKLGTGFALPFPMHLRIQKHR